MSTQRNSRSSAGGGDASDLQSMDVRGERELKKKTKLLQHVDINKSPAGSGSLQADVELNAPAMDLPNDQLSRAQYRYDARNVEALAAQMALQTWRTNLLGVQFEIYSDHDSLKYLFTQKEPSQRILRLCEFMVDFNFTELRYVPGPTNVVPDFLSYPWVDEQGQDRAVIRPPHWLSMTPPVRHTSMHSLQQDPFHQ